MVPLLVVWAACAIAGLVYAHQQNIPQSTALAVLPAFLLEAGFYFTLAVDSIRQKIERMSPWTVASGLFIAALIPYSIAALAVGTFNFGSLIYIAYLAFFASFSFVFLPKNTFWDVVYLAIMAAVMLLHTFPKLYSSPIPKLPIAVLGQIMWVRTGVFEMLAVRKVPGVGFGLWPDRRQWEIGTAYFLGFLLVAVGVAWKIGFARPHWPGTGWERTSLLAIGTFFGALWVVALGEEFFFRGLVQQWMSKWIGNEIGGLIATSVLFGCVHLWFRTFPNWRFAILAAIAGIFYGQAFRQTKSIKTSMVTHALVVTTWRVFFW